MIIPRLRAPIVLVHGLMGRSRVQLGNWTVFSYFPGITELFLAAGNRVFEADVGFTQGVAQRAAQLKAFLNRVSPDEPVHVLAHSMGGLDARYMISRLDMADRVLTLTTLGTPHRGTTFADWGILRLERLLRPFFEMLSVPYQAFFDLTVSRCREFNKQVPDAPGVRYFSVAGRLNPDWTSVRWLLSHGIVAEAEGINDGIVSLASATYGESCEVWDGDHLNLVNWPNRLAQVCGQWQEQTPRYAALICRLADEGF